MDYNLAVSGEAMPIKIEKECFWVLEEKWNKPTVKEEIPMHMNID